MRIWFLLLLAGSSLFASRNLYDNQLWLYAVYEHELPCNNEFFLMLQTRWRENGSRNYRKIVEGEVIHTFNKWIEIGPGYRNEWDTPLLFPGITVEGHIPFIDTFINIPFWIGSLRNRFRTQYFFIEDSFDAFSVRNRLTWFLPTIKQRHMTIEPYVEEEVFWRTFDGFFENRIYAGARIPLFGRFSSHIVYIRRMVRAGPFWEHNNVLALHLRYRCDRKKEEKNPILF